MEKNNELCESIDLLITKCPDLYKKTTVVGVFNGDEICTKFMTNFQYLDKITFYENFIFGPSEKVKLLMLAQYRKWENEVLNLKIKIEDGQFDVNQDFIYLNVYLLEHVFKKNRNVFRKINYKVWSAVPGFGSNVQCTYQICKLIENKDIYPICKITDDIYFAYNKKRRDEIYTQILPILTDFSEVHFEDYQILDYIQHDSYAHKSNML